MKIVHCLVFGAGLSLGCGDSAAGDADGEGTGSDATTTAVSTGSTATSSSGASADTAAGSSTVDDSTGVHASCQLAPGVHAETIEVAGTQRELSIAVGEQQGADPPAVLFAWHGFGQSADWQLGAVDAPTYWNDALVVAPQGLPRTFPQFGDQAQPGWQIAFDELENRDVLFFDAMVQWLTERGCLDPARVYSTGFSNGAYFSNALGCHRGDVLAAIAPVSGGGPYVTPCGPTVAAQITHGRTDGVVAFDNALATHAHWIAHNECDPDNPFADDGCAPATGCATTVEACSFDGGHTWLPDQAERVATFLRAQAR